MDTMEPEKKKRTRRTVFPLLIEFTDPVKQVVVDSPLELPLGQAFRILETKYKSAYKTVMDDD